MGSRVAEARWAQIGRRGNEHASPSRALALVVTASMVCALAPGCGGYTRFALRPPLWRDGDDRAFSPPPREDEEQDVANTIDVTLLHPIAHAWLFEPTVEARDVNSLDEVPDSSWFTNRATSVADVARAGCSADEPTPPFRVTSTKAGGTTPGLTVEDANGDRFVIKLDGLGPGQPEISTASDAIVSHLYWAVGFNVPCNRVLYVDAHDFVRDAHASERLSTGERRPLSQQRLEEILARATHGADGTLRIMASGFIEGQPLGTWRMEGTRGDDPNDTIPHEDRRELRGERLLAAWVGHWDSRGPQSYDAFVRTSALGGHVVHYFLDFGDSLGGTPTRTRWPEPRMGYETVSDVPAVLEDMFGFGLVRQPWDELQVDPRYPNLGFFEVEHFDPMGFAPQTPLVRWDRAQPADLGWMARRLARFDVEQIRAAVHTGRLSDAAEEARLIEILLGRRERVLRAAFARSSPLGDVAVIDDQLCAVDLASSLASSSSPSPRFEAELRDGVDPTPRRLAVQRAGALLCVRMPHHEVPSLTADGAAERYTIVELVRIEGEARTTLRAHLYDLGPERGFAWGGLERP